MCCESGERLDLPPRVIEMLAHYRRLLADQGFGWGEDGLPDMFRWARFSLLGPVFEAAQRTGDWPSAVRDVIGAEPPAGVVVVRVDADGAVRPLVGPARATIAGTPTAVDVVVDSAAGRPLAVRVAGEEVPVAAGGAGIATVDVAGPFEVEVDGRRHTVDGAVRTVPGGDPAAVRAALRPVVGERPERRRLVPRRRAAQVGRDPPAVLPRPRRRAGRAGRCARGLLRSGPRVRAGGARGHRRRRRHGRGGLRARPAVRPGGHRLVRR